MMLSDSIVKLRESVDMEHGRKGSIKDDRQKWIYGVSLWLYAASYCIAKFHFGSMKLEELL